MKKDNLWMTALFALVLMGLGLLFLAPSSSGTTITVDDDGGADYTKIQDAVDNATVGDTILVYQGVYEESVTVNKTLELVGNSSKNTIIRKEGRNGITINAPWVNLSGFSVEELAHGYAGIELGADNIRVSNCKCTDWRYGIYARNRRFCTLENNSLENNRENGIYFRGFFGVCYGNTLENNSCSGNQHSGVYFDGYVSTTTIRNNILWGNGRGITFYADAPAGTTDSAYYTTIENNIFLKNRHAGIFLYCVSNTTIQNNTLLENKEGIYISGRCPETRAHGNFFSGNLNHGVNASDAIVHVFNVTKNWWGDDSGPYHPIQNFNGTGDEVTNRTFFEPWLRLPEDHHRPEAKIHEKTPDTVVVNEEMTFHGEGTAYGQVARYVWVSSLDGELFNGTPGVFGTDKLSLGNHSIHFRVQNNYGFWSRNQSMNLVVKPMNRAPVVNISFPENLSRVKELVALTGFASDADGDPILVELAIAGGKWELANGSSPWTFDWDTGDLGNRYYWIRVRAYDGELYSEEVIIEVMVFNSGKAEEDYTGEMVYASLTLVMGIVVLVRVMRKRRRRKKS